MPRLAIHQGADEIYRLNTSSSLAYRGVAEEVTVSVYGHSNLKVSISRHPQPKVGGTGGQEIDGEG